MDCVVDEQVHTIPGTKLVRMERAVQLLRRVRAQRETGTMLLRFGRS